MKLIKLQIEIECADTTRPHPKADMELTDMMRLVTERALQNLMPIVTLGPIPKVDVIIIEQVSTQTPCTLHSTKDLGYTRPQDMPNYS